MISINKESSDYLNTIIYLIRHSIPITKDNIINNNNDVQNQNERLILSIEGEERAKQLSERNELKNIDAIYSSEYVRTIATAKYIAFHNKLKININSKFNERLYGVPNIHENKISFWMKQYLNSEYKNKNGESQVEVRSRMYDGIMEILKKHQGKRIVILSHGTCITFLLLKWCELKSIDKNKKRHITFNGKTVINDTLNTPDIFKIVFKNDVPVEILRISL